MKTGRTLTGSFLAEVLTVVTLFDPTMWTVRDRVITGKGGVSYNDAKALGGGESGRTNPNGKIFGVETSMIRGCTTSWKTC